MSNSTRQTADLGQSFVAIDFETATSERNSACAVGVVVFEQGSPTDTLSLLIRPPGNRICARRDQLATTIEDAFMDHPLGKVLAMCGFGPR